MGRCKKRGGSHPRETLNRSTNKLTTVPGRRFLHGKPSPEWIAPEDRVPCLSFLKAIKHAWVRREIQRLIEDGMTADEIRDKYNEALRFNGIRS